MPSNEKLLQVINIQTELAKLGLDLGAVMQFTVEQVLPLIDADGAVIELAEKGDMVYRAASGIAEDKLGLRLKMDSSLSGRCVSTGEVLTCADSEIDPRVDINACRQIGLRSMLVVPLKHLGTTVGVLKAMSTRVNKFSEPELQLLNMITEMVAAIMFLSERYDRDALFIKATQDGLTGLANKAFFMDRLRSTLTQKQAINQSIAIVICDMDGLKQINDNLGHRVGDAAIQEFANRMRLVTTDKDLIARLGGDEFGIISPIKQNQDIDDLVTRLQAELLLPLLFESNPVQLKASIGFSITPAEGIEIDHLLDLADKRMYSVKRARYAAKMK
ncbi:sensor domain-containing diguanylate cyclase [Shewanella acanthi]|uniref:sensor domain-containing diguanylate cyclase n=1 Tax=Shewanella acanthi TaxID=2864212 RepID=UPI001C65F18C|nr:sensor domain-containing diguanylate cyclase [Shewanella acanthi]QYJ77385.1 sensor domain-containing diguanylate cyclase [Shewanella acanthi]